MREKNIENERDDRMYGRELKSGTPLSSVSY